MQDDIVIPLFRLQWSTRAVYEGVCQHYAPARLHVIAPAETAAALTRAADRERWAVGPIHVHTEEDFFVEKHGLTKDDLANELRLGESLYPAGWYYQQLLKLGAADGIAELSDWFLIWDSDLLPVETWPVIDADGRRRFALLQDRSRGNPDIVGRWADWIGRVLGVEPITDPEATFVPHHMWFGQRHLAAMQDRVRAFVDGDLPWPAAMMRTANTFGTFSEFWAYASWVHAHAPADRLFYPYDTYGRTTERFFEDGTAIFAQRFRAARGLSADVPLRPAYADLLAFIHDEYNATGDPLPSSLSFEASPRHRKKGRANMHTEELRSRWHNAEE
ncbi:MAG: DUF6492 family protein [Planctomycetota bacterium]